ncbi:MAG: sigma-70 family RNA polymerase sigma factor [Planctomycetota bacterium]
MTDEASKVPVETLLRHERFVRNLVRGLVGDSVAAADLAQDTWLTALTYPPSHDSRLRGWFGRVARNIAGQRARSEARRMRRETIAAQPERLPSAAEIAERLEVQRRAVEAVQQLEEIYRSVVYLHFFEDLPAGDIAERLGVPEATVRTRLRRALEMLRERLDEVHDGDRGAWLAALVPWTWKAAATAAAGGSTILAVEGAHRLLTTGLALKGAGAAATLIVASLLVVPALRDSLSSSHEELDPGALPTLTGITAAADPGGPTGEPIQRTAALAALAAASASQDEDATGGTIHGTVVNGLREPLAGAQVEVYAPPYDFSDREVPIGSALTSDNGEFEIEGLPIQRLTLRISKECYTTRRQAADLGPHKRGSELSRLILYEARTLSGIVRGADGKPLAGAWVLGFNESRIIQFEWPSARTDASGRFTLKDLPFCGIKITVFARGHAAVQRGPFDAGTHQVEVNLAAQPSAVLHVVARDADGVTPLAGASPRLTEYAEDRFPPIYYRMPVGLSDGLTDDAGRFTYEFLPPGRYKLGISAKDHYFTHDQGKQQVVLTCGEERTIEFAGKAGDPLLTLTGTLGLSDGVSPAGYTVCAASAPFRKPYLAATDNDGSFSIRSPVPAGVSFYMWLAAGNYALGAPNGKAGYSLIVATPGVPLQLAAVPGASVRGYVQFANGRPAPAVNVQLLGDGHLTDCLISGETDREGYFAFEGLGPVNGPVRVKVKGPCGDVVAPETYELKAATNIDNVTITLSETARLAGTVVNSDGSPAPGIYLHAQADFTLSDPEGRFVLDRLQPGEQEIKPTPFDESSPRRQVIGLFLGPGEDRHGFTIELLGEEGTPGTIRGRVVWESGEPVYSYSAALSKGNQRREYSTARPGEFVFTDLEDGVYLLSAYFTSHHTDEGSPVFLTSPEVEISPGAPPVVLQISRTKVGMASGRFPDSPSFELPDRLEGYLTVIRADGSRGFGRNVQVFIDEGGFHLPPVSTGRYEFQLDGRTIRPKKLLVRIIEGGNTDLGVVDFEPAQLIVGYVTDRHGTPLPGAYVGNGFTSQLDSRVSHRDYGVTTDTSGRFELYNQDEELEISKEGYAPLRLKPSRLARGEPQAIKLRPCGQIDLINIPVELSSEQGTSWCIRANCEESEAYLGDYPRCAEVTSKSDWGLRTTIYRLPEGIHTVHFWEKSGGSDWEPPANPEPHKYYRWQVRVIAGETVTIDVGAEW